MRDCYGRQIDYMRISITDRCNLRCRYCMPNEGVEWVTMDKILSYEEIIRTCQAAARAGIKKIKITGGEPLVRVGCPELIGRIKKIPGIEQVTMTSNGVLLEKYLPELIENGLDAVNISMDTLKPDVYREITGRDELEQVLRSIDAALAVGIPVKINCVLQKDMNDEEFLELARLSVEKNVDVRFIEMMPIGFGKDYETIYNDDILNKLKEAYPEMEEDHTVHGNGPAVYVKLPGAKGSVGFISAMHGKFCEYCNRIRLTSQGKLKPCLCYGQSVDLKAVLEQKDDEALYEAIVQAIKDKPESHRFESLAEITEKKRMIEIGG